MADKTRKLEGNVAGPFYVDDACSLCQTCIQLAPDHFKESDGHAVVCKQPGSEQEIALCQEALESCPSEAIGNDGE